MPVEPDDRRLVYMKEADILAAQGACFALRNLFFAVHPQHGLVFWQTNPKRKGELQGSHPQGNHSEATARTLAGKLYPWAEIRHYPLVLWPIKISDYRE